MMPNASIAILGETNAFWEIRLGHDPRAVVRDAGALARRLVRRAQEAFVRSPVPSVAELMTAAELELAAGDVCPPEGPPATLARALRHYTRAQVRAQQALHATARVTTVGRLPGRRRPGVTKLAS